MAYKKTKNDLITELGEQIKLLDNKTMLFDGGYEIESKDIAVKIRLLLSDTKNSKSLLTRLGIKTKVTYYSTGKDSLPNFYEKKKIGPNRFQVSRGIGSNLVTMTAYHGISWKFQPVFDARGFRKNNFDYWWSETIYTIGDKRYNREQIIHALVDQDGGAHADEILKDDDYVLLSRNIDDYLISQDQQGNKKSLGNLVYPIVRQIAHELRKTLNDECIKSVE